MCLAIPGRITKIEGQDFERLATVDFGGTRKSVNLAFLPETKVGDFVMVHVGFAIAKVDEEAAKSAYSLFEGNPS